MRILKRREHGKSVSHMLTFPGFAFPCDSSGNVSASELTGAGLANYTRCDSTGKGVVEETSHTYTVPAIGECNHCGEEVQLSGFTNTCDCGVDYNMSGQELAPRAQWGEETGESLADILSIP
jgi:hypothetical protein